MNEIQQRFWDVNVPANCIERCEKVAQSLIDEAKRRETEGIFNQIEELDQQLSYIEDIAKGQVGDLITKARGISSNLYSEVLKKILPLPPSTKQPTNE